MKVVASDAWRDILASKCKERSEPRAPTLFVTAGKAYTVYGVSFRNVVGSGGSFLEVLDDYGNLVSAPADVFQIVDGSIPQLWVARMKEDGLCLWPEAFFAKYFFDDLSDGEPEALSKFADVRLVLG